MIKNILNLLDPREGGEWQQQQPNDLNSEQAGGAERHRERSPGPQLLCQDEGCSGEAASHHHHGKTVLH